MKIPNMMNVLPLAIEKVPSWIIHAVVGILLTSGVAWTTWVTVASQKHETQIAIVETKIASVGDNIREIKDGQKTMNQKLDRLIERRPR